MAQSDLMHGRFKEDYMTPENEVFQQGDEPNFQRELNHGRFKEDYMKLQADSREQNNVKSDEPQCTLSENLDGDVAGCVTEWSIVMYGTA